MDLKKILPEAWVVLYLLIGFVAANGIRFAGHRLARFRPTRRPWWVKVLFPLNVTLREYRDPPTWGTLFWGGTHACEVLGIFVLTLVWPVRIAGALLGWAAIGLLDATVDAWRTYAHWRGR